MNITSFNFAKRKDDAARRFLKSAKAGTLAEPSLNQSSYPLPTKSYSNIKTGATLAEENIREDYGKDSNIINVRKPQRIDLPRYFNVPIRKDFLLSPNKYRVKTSDGRSRYLLNNSNVLNMSYGDHYDLARSRKRIKDYEILALACKRANKFKDEGRAYYCMGVLYENIGKTLIAINMYKKFLYICIKISDSNGESLAYNTIGIVYQKMGERCPKFYNDAIEFHLKHKEIADINGKFIAHINLGQIYEKIGEKEKSAVNLQFALKYAIQMSSIAGQTIAVGNLVYLGSQNSIIADQTTLKLFVDRFIQLSSETNCKKGLAMALDKLAKLKKEKGNLNKSVEILSRVVTINKRIENNPLKNLAKVNYGITLGENKWNSYRKDIIDTIGRIKRY